MAMQVSMKRMKYLKVVLIILAGSFSYDANSQPGPATQKSIVSEKIVVLKYHDHLDTLEVPVVSDRYPALKKALSYKNIFYGDDLPDVIKNYANCECGITSLGYEVTYEGENILSIKIYVETSAAYPDDSEEWFTLNSTTGKPYPISKEINPKGLKWLFDSYKTELKKRIYKYKNENPDEDIDAYNELKAAIDSLHSDELFSKYVFTKQGIALSIEKILPHALQNMEPDRDVLIPYGKLKIYKAPGALVIR
jgi:hypothetical protein